MRKILDYDDFILREDYFFVDNLLIKESIASDISIYLRSVFQKIKSLSFERKRKIIIYAIGGLLAFTSADKIMSVLNTDEYIKAELINSPDIKGVIDEKLKDLSDTTKIQLSSNFKDATKMRVSSEGIKKIKLEEGDTRKPGQAVLKAYKLGDGRITIGWGHAEPIGKSKFRVGQKINLSRANKLLKEDLKEAADGVRRIFSEWKDQGIDRKVTQEQFDALVSLALNIGVSGLRQSEAIQELKRGDYQGAGQKIKVTNISDNMPGLEARRDRESKPFLNFI